MSNRSGAEESGGRAEARKNRRGSNALLFGAAAAAAILWGCGQQAAETRVSDAGTQSVAAEPAALTMPASAPGSAVASGSMPKAGAPEGLPPDISFSVGDTLVSPGEPITITVDATSDVKEILLSDGINDPQAFYHDLSTDTWRVDYRVPLKPRQERLGLSVTAKNEANRWRRLWVFLHVKSATPEVKATADSTAGSGT